MDVIAGKHSNSAQRREMDPSAFKKHQYTCQKGKLREPAPRPPAPPPQKFLYRCQNRRTLESLPRPPTGREVEPSVRCNLVIAVGDLAFRFPNLLEPWTEHMYRPLADADLGAGSWALAKQSSGHISRL